MLTLVHQCGELGPARPELVGNVPPGLMRGRGVGLQESLADRGGDHGVLALGHVRQGVAHPTRIDQAGLLWLLNGDKLLEIAAARTDPL